MKHETVIRVHIEYMYIDRYSVYAAAAAAAAGLAGLIATVSFCRL